jgi:phosphatidylglycerophosphatase A
MMSDVSGATRSELWARRIATVFGLGERLPAPGTSAGSLPAALLWWALCAVGPAAHWLHLATVAGVMVSVVVGIWAADVEARRRGEHDPRPVVIDEVAGQWLTFLVALPWLSLATVRAQALTIGVGFFVFRLCDVVKPWPGRRLERLSGGLGIVADDLAAGLYAGLLLALAARWITA